MRGIRFKAVRTSSKCGWLDLRMIVLLVDDGTESGVDFGEYSAG